jgi:hypothetical protein
MTRQQHARKIGLRNAQTGHIQRIQKIGCSLGGQAIADANMKSGRWSRIRKLGLSIGGKTQTHLRWHVARDIFQPNCELCRNQLEQPAQAEGNINEQTREQ